jgi:hypothetical protein
VSDSSALSSTVAGTSPLSDVAIFPQAQESGCEKPRTGVVSEVPQGLSDEELVAHIADCRLLMRLAQARFRGSHAAKDLQDAEFWEARMDDGIKARQAVYRERMADESTFQGEWTQEVLARAGAYFDVSPAAVRRRMG